jgi:hypothetical protein
MVKTITLKEKLVQKLYRLLHYCLRKSNARKLVCLKHHKLTQVYPLYSKEQSIEEPIDL